MDGVLIARRRRLAEFGDGPWRPMAGAESGADQSGTVIFDETWLNTLHSITIQGESSYHLFCFWRMAEDGDDVYRHTSSWLAQLHSQACE